MFVAALTACGEEKNEPDTVEVPLLPGGVNLGECSAAWVSLTGGNGSDSEPPVDLLFARGNLFFFRFSWGLEGATTSELVRFVVNSGNREIATTVLVPNTYSSPIWVDNGELVFTQSNEVRSVPLAGGEMRVRSSYDSSEKGDVQWLGISNGNFYFSRYGKQGAIWRISLEGGAIELFAELGEDWGYQIEPPLINSPEGLLLNGQRQGEDLEERPVTVVIEPNGVVRDLPFPEGSYFKPQLTPTGVVHTISVPDSLMSVDEGSDEASTSDEDVAEQLETVQAPLWEPVNVKMWITPLSGGDASEFWPDRPVDARPDHVESDGEDGWFVTATEGFNDGYRHDTLWHIRPNVAARRLACNPRPENSRIHTESRIGNSFASGDGFVYLVSSSRESEFWELVKISYLPVDERPLEP